MIVKEKTASFHNVQYVLHSRREAKWPQICAVIAQIPKINQQRRGSKNCAWPGKPATSAIFRAGTEDYRSVPRTLHRGVLSVKVADTADAELKPTRLRTFAHGELNQVRSSGCLLTYPGYWKMCRGARAGVKALRPRSGALQRGLDSGPASAMLCLSGECHLLPYPAGNISAKLTGKRPPVSSPSLCASSITCLLGSYWRRGVLAAKF
jgi:hypothetical protein